jgi:hypothetical protein
MEVHDVLWDLLKDVQIDAKQRQLIWPDAERLDLEQSIQRIQKLYPDFPRDEVEEFVLNWIDMGYYPENYSQAQLRRNSTSLTASQSNGSPTISERAQKNERELGTLELSKMAFPLARSWRGSSGICARSTAVMGPTSATRRRRVTIAAAIRT